MTNTAKQPKSKKQVHTEEFLTYLNYLLSGEVESEEKAEQVNRAAKRSASVSDATLISKAAVAGIQQQLTQVMEVIRIQQIVLEKLGATSEMFEEANKQYQKELEETRKQLEEQAKKVQEQEKEE